MSDEPFLTIITPTFNEAETIETCILTVQKVLSEHNPELKYEHIIVDNASTDETVGIALRLTESHPNLKVALNDRNIGGTRNIYRGLSLASGVWIVPMLPADLQDPAEVIPLMLDKISIETNVVFGVRKKRKESLTMRVLRNIYYRLIRRFSASDMPLHSGEFCLIHESVATSLVTIEDENPYVRGLIAQSARSPKYVEYTWGKRQAGESKASPLVLAEVAVTGLVSTSQIPARIALLSGFFISMGSIIWAFIQILLVLFSKGSSSPGIPTIIVAIFFFGGVQLFFIGIIGEYVLSIHRQVKKAPAVRTRFLSRTWE